MPQLLAPQSRRVSNPEAGQAKELVRFATSSTEGEQEAAENQKNIHKNLHKALLVSFELHRTHEKTLKHL